MWNLSSVLKRLQELSDADKLQGLIPEGKHFISEDWISGRKRHNPHLNIVSCAVLKETHRNASVLCQAKLIKVF